MSKEDREEARDNGGIVFDVAILSDIGTSRDENEDHFGLLFEDTSHLLVAVADGVSGEEAGEVASQIAVETVVESFASARPAKSPARRLSRAVQHANIAVFDKASVVPELRRMGTTLTAVFLAEGNLTAAHVGDCRLYLLHDGALTQLTKDHTVVAERVRHRLLSEEQAKDHPHRSVLTRSLGRELIAAVDVLSIPIQRGDALLLCSDGLYNVLAPDELKGELRDGATAEDTCRSLISKANARGTPDNLTVCVVRVVGAMGGGPSERPRLWARWWARPWNSWRR